MHGRSSHQHLFFFFRFFDGKYRKTQCKMRYVLWFCVIGRANTLEVLAAKSKHPVVWKSLWHFDPGYLTSSLLLPLELTRPGYQATTCFQPSTRSHAAKDGPIHGGVAVNYHPSTQNSSDNSYLHPVRVAYSSHARALPRPLLSRPMSFAYWSL